MVFAVSASALLSGCLGSQTPDLSGAWENDEVGTLNLTQSEKMLSAEQKDPERKLFFGPKIFEGSIQENLMTGKIAVALSTNLRETCGQNWGSWADIELQVAPDGLSLEGRWLRTRHNTTVQGCPLMSTDWAPLRLTRSAGQPPVISQKVPKWVPALVFMVGVLLAAGFRHALVSYLVGPMKRSPNQASLAGWMLFTAFASASAALSAPLWGNQLASPLVWGPLAGLSALGVLAALLISLKR
jgi:hypothetical protein